jgi:hypothetical protein
MAFIPAPNGIAVLRTTWSQAGMIGQNVMHVRETAGANLNVANLNDMVDQALHAYNLNTNDGPLGPLADEVALTRVECVSLADQSSPGVVRDVNLPGHNSTATPAPPGVSLVITHNTGFRGRWNRGRTFMMGVGTADINVAGGVVSAALSTWQDAWDGFLLGIGDGAVIDMDLVVLSYFENKAPRSIATYAPVTSLTVKPHVASQRRRNVN